MSFVNKYTTYYVIDTEKNLIELNQDDNYTKNLMLFIKNKLGELYFNEANRKYFIKDANTEVIKHLSNLIEKSDFSEKEKISKQIAEKLLKEEKNVQLKISKLNQSVQSGGLIITHFEKNKTEYISLVKVHYIDFYEESTFLEKRGLPKKEVILKTCITKVFNNELDEDFYLSDSTKSKGILSADFWWNKFLELETVFTNKDNTSNSFSKIDCFFDKKFDYKEDYWYMRNNLLGFYRTNEKFDINKMVSQTLKSFDLICLEDKSDDEKENYKKNLKSELKKIYLDKNENRLFDTEFFIERKEINKKIKKRIELGNNIDLNINGQVRDFKKTIIAEKDLQDKKYIKIYTDKGYDEFKS